MSIKEQLILIIRSKKIIPVEETRKRYTFFVMVKNVTFNHSLKQNWFFFVKNKVTEANLLISCKQFGFVCQDILDGGQIW